MDRSEFRWGPFRSGDLPGLLGEAPPALPPVPSDSQYVPTEPAQLQWVVLGGKLFATVPIAAGKWKELKASQLIPGVEICVNGLRFLMRLPVFGYDTEIFNSKRQGSSWACWAIDGRIPSAVDAMGSGVPCSPLPGFGTNYARHGSPGGATCQSDDAKGVSGRPAPGDHRLRPGFRGLQGPAFG